MADFVMPALGADMTEGTLVAWLKKPGEAVKRGEVLAEVETSKGIIEIESFTSGVLEKVLVEPMTVVPVGTVLAIIREEGKPARAAPSSAVAPAPAPAAQPAAAPAPPPPVLAPQPGRMRISPAAKQRAFELGIDPASTTGTGPGGAISLEDIERAAAKARPEAKADRQAWMRQTIAAAMARSKREIPHYYLSTTIDMGPAMAWLQEENRRRPVTGRLLPAVLLIKTVALALRELPELNAVWKEGQAVQSQSIHVGVAISLRQGGLVAPALHDTDRLNVDELMSRLSDLVKRARAGSLRASELSDPTITVTNLGEQGVESVFGIIYPPQVALVGFGKIVERPWVADKQVVVRPILTASLSADHRVTDGHRGGLFLAAIDRLLQDPTRL